MRVFQVQRRPWTIGSECEPRTCAEWQGGLRETSHKNPQRETAGSLTPALISHDSTKETGPVTNQVLSWKSACEKQSLLEPPWIPVFVSLGGIYLSLLVSFLFLYPFLFHIRIKHACMSRASPLKKKKKKKKKWGSAVISIADSDLCRLHLCYIKIHELSLFGWRVCRFNCAASRRSLIGLWSRSGTDTICFFCIFEGLVRINNPAGFLMQSSKWNWFF